MPIYAYKAHDRTNGQATNGEIVASSQMDAITQLKQRGFLPIEVRERRSGPPVPAPNPDIDTLLGRIDAVLQSIPAGGAAWGLAINGTGMAVARVSETFPSVVWCQRLQPKPGVTWTWDEIEALLDGMIVRCNITHARVTIALGAPFVNSRGVNVPIINPSKMRDMVELEARQQIPGDFAAHAWTYTSSMAHDQASMDIMMTWMPQERLKHLDLQTTLLAPRQLVRSAILPESEGVRIAGATSWQRDPDDAAAHGPDEPAAIGAALHAAGIGSSDADLAPRKCRGITIQKDVLIAGGVVMICILIVVLALTTQSKQAQTPPPEPVGTAGSTIIATAQRLVGSENPEAIIDFLHQDGQQITPRGRARLFERAADLLAPVDPVNAITAYRSALRSIGAIGYDVDPQTVEAKRWEDTVRQKLNRLLAATPPDRVPPIEASTSPPTTRPSPAPTRRASEPGPEPERPGFGFSAP